MQDDSSLGPGRFLLALFALCLLALLVFASAVSAQEEQLDCASFGSQESAQAELERDPSDPFNLDSNNNGQACEDFDFGTTGASQQPADAGGETTAETTSSASASASASPAETTSSANAQTADVNRDADEFRCEFFLHVVRDVRGNVRRQYQDDEQITRRFERCLSKDVIPGTIVKRKLPATGGVPLLVLGFPAIALVGAGILLARRR
jgi:hypothetical protein